MNAERLFLDANVLVYAYDNTAGRKHERAKEIVRQCWASEKPPKISIQVLQETHVTLVKKRLDPATSADVVRNYLAWDVVENRESVFRDALELQTQCQISFWDASILAAAIASGAEELWSEDFQNGRVYRGVRVVNPFQEALD
ncbi:MAG TPA: PIN domain-containing protein [Verrucomicrobiales bacterium]|nr:PIN domain-containing protein [Verrucomicrobiales bacterium]